MIRRSAVLVLLGLLAISATAATLTGTVTNATTGKPSAGDDVALLGMSQGMNVLAQTKSDANGKFSFNIDDQSTPHLVRVTHGGASYFPQGGPVRPGATTVEVNVYDSAKKLDGVATNVNVMRLQAEKDTLQVLELIAVKNDSKPPRTLAGERTFEFYLPAGAHVDQAIVQGPGGMPVNTTATPDGNSGKHYFTYALKPGETRFEIAYHLPYAGEATFAPKITDNIQHFVVMMPKSMNFEAKNASRFSPMNEDPSATVQVATGVTPGTDLAFRVSGTGVLQDEQRGGAEQAQGGGAMGGDSRPGGGLGPPTDAPDPLHSIRWYILGGLAIVLVSGGVFVVSRANQHGGGAQSAPVQAAAAPAVVPTATPAVKDRSTLLLEALKDELFQLEVERQQGKISQEEYEKSRAALDQTLSRALARKSGS
ncbi:MAG TPA: carboxypeptidase-like regulatory domain-containing protein [Terriglobales bacterium]|nr:carboxypeptidase-like regulatory domain-containing protein [Terriglobales bacterium]